MLTTAPAVFAVGHEYQIMFYTDAPAFITLKISDREFYDESNGIMRSLKNIHRITVPMEILDQACAYIVCEEPLIERKPYFTETKEIEETKYTFKPVPEKNARAYHISDAHNYIEAPVAAAQIFGDIDFLIFNGDILNDSGNMDNFLNIYEIASKLTKGSRPIVFSRGNHDLRGIYAETFADYTPADNGNTYYTFRLGSIWGIVLDCGEDKDDSHPEYGHSVRCHPFRLRETEFIKKVISNASDEYLAPGVETRLVIVHNPFTEKTGAPFDIEEEIYKEWSELLRDNVKPHAMICGHVHEFGIDPIGCERDAIGQPCTIILSSYLEYEKGICGGAGFVFGDDKIGITFTTSEGNIISENSILK